MNLSINQNNNSNKQYGVKLPSSAAEIHKSASDFVNSSNNIVVNAYEYKENPQLLFGVTIPVWAGISAFMAKFNKSCATALKDGKETSLLHRVQDFSDKFGIKFDSSSIGKKINNTNSKITSFIDKKIISKNNFLNAVIHTPSLPKSSMAKMISKGTIAETAQDAIEAIERYCINSGKSIEELGLMKNQEFSKISSDPYKHLSEIKQILKKIPEQPIEVCRNQNKVVKKILSRKVYPSELLNKINTLTGKSLRGDKPQLSKLGKVLPKSFLRGMEGLTNGTAGGKVAIFMQAYSIADGIIRAFQAPKGEKLKTFMESITYDLSYYLMMPAAMSVMYGAGGTKYLGMTPEQVEKYRKGVKLLNEKVASGNCSKVQYDRVKSMLKNQLKGNTKLSVEKDGVAKTALKAFTNIFNKPVKALGTVLSGGLETIAPYTNKESSVVEHLAKKLPNKLKGILGGAMRFGLYLFVIAPPLAKFMTKISHVIFGKPVYSILDDKAVDDVTPEHVVSTVTPKAPNKEFDKIFYSKETNYIEMYKEALRLEKERLELLSQKKADLKTVDVNLETKTEKTIITDKEIKQAEEKVNNSNNTSDISAEKINLSDVKAYEKLISGKISSRNIENGVELSKVKEYELIKGAKDSLKVENSSSIVSKTITTPERKQQVSNKKKSDKNIELKTWKMTDKVRKAMYNSVAAENNAKKYL